jgi:uncharacterized membrane protein
MTKTRLEAFSDGVIAIIITIMVLELKVPHRTEWHTLQPLIPVVMSYLLSFVFLGIYWANHHHLVHTVSTVNSGLLWANLHLLFWLSLIPFATAWMGESNFQKIPVALYAVITDMCGIAYYIFLINIKKNEKDNSGIHRILRKQTQKGIISTIAYTAAIPLSFVHPLISCSIFVGIAIVWIVPDTNIENANLPANKSEQLVDKMEKTIQKMEDSIEKK